MCARPAPNIVKSPASRPGVPSQPVRLDADPVRVTQMITNLLNNANKFTTRGGRIFLDVEVQGEAVLIQVRDEGVGIAAENLAHIFEMFAQINEGPDGTNGGLGIGLTLVRSLAAMHGGSVEASSGGRCWNGRHICIAPAFVGLFPNSPAERG